jgi:hypothetical protein
MECAKNESDFFRFMACDYGYDEEARNRLIDQAKLVGMFAFLFFIVLATRRGSDQQGSIFNFRTCPGALLSKIKGAPQEERIYSFEEALAANPILGMALHNASVNPQSVARGSLIFCSIDGYECYVPRAAYNEIAREYHFQEEIK